MVKARGCRIFYYEVYEVDSAECGPLIPSLCCPTYINQAFLNHRHDSKTVYDLRVKTQSFTSETPDQ